MEMVIDHIIQPTDCLLSFVDENEELVDQESFALQVGKADTNKDAEIKTLKDMNPDFGFALNYFSKRIEAHKTTAWRIVLKVDGNISGKVLRAGEQPIYVAFGERSPMLLASDYVFPLDPQSSDFIIPKEVVWKNYRSYSQDSYLACFQIVQADFHRIDNVYYKAQISNVIELNKIDRRTNKSLKEFYNPLGEPFNPKYWRIHNNLPVPQ